MRSELAGDTRLDEIYPRRCAGVLNRFVTLRLADSRAFAAEGERLAALHL